MQGEPDQNTRTETDGPYGLPSGPCGPAHHTLRNTALGGNR